MSSRISRASVGMPATVEDVDDRGAALPDTKKSAVANPEAPSNLSKLDSGYSSRTHHRDTPAADPSAGSAPSTMRPPPAAPDPPTAEPLPEPVAAVPRLDTTGDVPGGERQPRARKESGQHRPSRPRRDDFPPQPRFFPPPYAYRPHPQTYPHMFAPPFPGAGHPPIPPPGGPIAPPPMMPYPPGHLPAPAPFHGPPIRRPQLGHHRQSFYGNETHDRFNERLGNPINPPSNSPIGQPPLYNPPHALQPAVPVGLRPSRHHTRGSDGRASRTLYYNVMDSDPDPNLFTAIELSPSNHHRRRRGTAGTTRSPDRMDRERLRGRDPYDANIEALRESFESGLYLRGERRHGHGSYREPHELYRHRARRRSRSSSSSSSSDGSARRDRRISHSRRRPTSYLEWYDERAHHRSSPHRYDEYESRPTYAAPLRYNPPEERDRSSSSEYGSRNRRHERHRSERRARTHRRRHASPPAFGTRPPERPIDPPQAGISAAEQAEAYMNRVRGGPIDDLARTMRDAYEPTPDRQAAIGNSGGSSSGSGSSHRRHATHRSGHHRHRRGSRADDVQVRMNINGHERSFDLREGPHTITVDREGVHEVRFRRETAADTPGANYNEERRARKRAQRARDRLFGG